jgi:hypothetical protein
MVTSAPAYVNPKTAELQLRTDPLPLIFKGIPVRVRDIQVHLDRPNFTLNPTNCDRFSLDGTLFSSEGKSKASSTPFRRPSAPASASNPDSPLASSAAPNEAPIPNSGACSKHAQAMPT